MLANRPGRVFRQVSSLSPAAAGPLAVSRAEDKGFIVQGDKSSAHLKARHQSRPLAVCAPQVSTVCPVRGEQVSGQRDRDHLSAGGEQNKEPPVP